MGRFSSQFFDRGHRKIMVVISRNSISHINIPSISHKITVPRGYIYSYYRWNITAIFPFALHDRCSSRIHPLFTNWLVVSRHPSEKKDFVSCHDEKCSKPPSQAAQTNDSYSISHGQFQTLNHKSSHLLPLSTFSTLDGQSQNVMDLVNGGFRALDCKLWIGL